MREFRVDMRCS